MGVTSPLTAGSVDLDIQKIIHSNSMHPKAIKRRVILHTVNLDIDITQLYSIEYSRDYGNNLADYTLVTFGMTAGAWVHDVAANIDNLEMSIISSYYGDAKVERFKFIPVKYPNNNAGSLYSGMSRDALDKSALFEIEGQCLNRVIEVLRHKPTDGIFHYTNVKDVITNITMNALNDLAIDGTKPDVRINIVPPNNAKSYRHIMVPLGTKVVDIPSFLQNTKYGVYSSGVGSYLQKADYFVKGKEPIDTYYVYPLYNHELADEPGNKLMIFSTPNVRYQHVDNTFMLDGDILKIVSHGDIVGGDTSQKNLMRDGDSVANTTRGTVLTNGSAVTDNTLKSTKSDNLTTNTMYKKKDGNVGVNYVGPVDNLYKFHSDVAANALSPYQITWKFSNPELLFPGMPVIFVYNDANTGVVRLRGTVHSTFTKYSHGSGAHVTILNILLESFTESKAQSAQKVDVTY